MSRILAKKKTSKEAVSKAEVKQMVKSILSEVQELKIFIVQSSASVDYGGSIVDCSAITQGDTDITRDGDRVHTSEWTFRWHADVGDATNAVRVILFQWIPDSALGAPSVTDVVQTTGSATAPMSYYSIDHVKNVKILYDRTVTVDTYHPIHMPPPVTMKKLGDKQMQFTGATSRTNGLYALFISDSAASTHPSVVYYSTVRFTDS